MYPHLESLCETREIEGFERLQAGMCELQVLWRGEAGDVKHSEETEYLKATSS